MFLINPCKKCLVQACCSEVCEIKEGSIRTHVNLADTLFGTIPVTIALIVLLYVSLVS